MEKTQISKHGNTVSGDMLSEYSFDYRKARSNRFTTQTDKEQLVVTLDPDVAKVFVTPESVNKILRALITTMPRISKGRSVVRP